MRLTVLHFLGWILLIWNGCSFEVLAEHQTVYQTKQTGSAGDHLFIGSLNPTPTFLQAMPSIAYFGILCTSGKYEDHFGPEIYKSSEGKTNEVELSEYFLKVYHSIWLCKPAGRPDSTDEFLSIDTILVSIKDIYCIVYEDGIQVNLKKFDVDRVEVIKRLCAAKNKEDKTFSIRFKCLDDWDYAQGTEEISLIPDLASKILTNPPHTVHHEKSEEEYYEDVPVQETSTAISDKGLSIRIEPTPSVIGKPNKKYACRPSFVNTELFLPKCYQRIGEHYAQIPQEEFGKLFIIVIREVLICESKENDRIFRISHTVIGRADVSDIEYGNGIIELYAIDLPDGGKSIRYQEARYFDAKTRNPVMDYNVQYMFTYMEHFMSSVVMETDGSIQPIDIYYKLPPRSIFRVLIGPEGYNIRIGSRPVADIDADDVKCNILMKNTCDYKYGVDIEMIIVDQNGLQHTLVHDREVIHDKLLDQNIWSCASEKNKSVNFLRVTNYIKIKEPIHYIETYDGIEIFKSGKQYQNNVLYIYEVKYLSNEKAVRFVGKMKTGYRFYRSADAGATPQAVKKGEIYPLPTTDIPTREHISRDYQWDGKQYERFENEKNQRKTMRLEVNGDSNLGTNQPQVIICKATETLVERIPFFEIKKETESIESMQSDTDRTLNEKYFDNMESEKWLCSEVKREEKASTSSSPTEIVRVITKQTLKRPNDICVIEHTPLDRLWFEMSNNDYQTKMEGIRYYRKEGEKFKLYNNLSSCVIFEHDPPTGVWKSGTKHLDSFNGKSKTLHEILWYDESYYDPEKMYLLNMNNASDIKRTLLIGSKWMEIYGNYQTKLTCVEEKKLAKREFSKTDSVFLTKISQQGEENDENKFHNDFNLLSLKIWKCTDEDNSEMSLYGIMNTFTLKHVEDTSLKEVKFYDGVTVLHGNRNRKNLQNRKMSYEFTEFKYLNENDGEMSAVKFEGNVRMASGSGLAQVTTKFVKKGAKDTEHVLNQADPERNEVFRTKINNKGVILEIGGRLLPDPNAESILDLHCINLGDYISTEIVKYNGSSYFPRILKFNSTNHPVLMTPEEIHDFFDLTQKVQNCSVTEDSNPTSLLYYRVVTVLKWKNTKSLSQIYHYDEVNIHDSDNQLIIEDVEYLLHEEIRQEDGSLQKIYKAVKLDHFRTLPTEEFEERHMRHREKINYRLDKEIWQLYNAKETGVTIQFESHYVTIISIADPDTFVTCLKIKDHPVADPKYNSKICLNIGSEDEEMEYVDVSEFPALKQVSQDIWRCRFGEDLNFLIVKNKMIATDTKMRVYHKPQVSVGTLFLPNGEEVLLISDEKYLKEEQSEEGEYEYQVIRFYGTIKYVLETLPEADTFRFLIHNIKAPARILAERTREHIWSLDSVRFLAFRDLELAEHPIQGVHYSGDIHQQVFHTKILDSGASRMFQLGRLYDKVLNTEDLHEGKPLECIQFTWDSAFTPKYTPRVAEYFGMHLHTMDKQTFDENFQVIDVAVWICTNKFNELLRVRTVYKPIQEELIFAVRYTDGIEVEVSENGKNLIKVNEILYMDVLALDVYRYDGDLQERVVPVPRILPNTESHEGGSSMESDCERDVVDVPLDNAVPVEHVETEEVEDHPGESDSVAAKEESCLIPSFKTLKGLFNFLKPFFKIPKLRNSPKSSEPSPGKPKA